MGGRHGMNELLLICTRVPLQSITYQPAVLKASEYGLAPGNPVFITNPRNGYIGPRNAFFTQSKKAIIRDITEILKLVIKILIKVNDVNGQCVRLLHVVWS